MKHTKNTDFSFQALLIRVVCTRAIWVLCIPLATLKENRLYTTSSYRKFLWRKFHWTKMWNANESYSKYLELVNHTWLMTPCKIFIKNHFKKVKYGSLAPKEHNQYEGQDIENLSTVAQRKRIRNSIFSDRLDTKIEKLFYIKFLSDLWINFFGWKIVLFFKKHVCL